MQCGHQSAYRQYRPGRVALGLGPRPPSLVRVRAYSIPYLTCEAIVAQAVWQAPNASNDPPNRIDASELPGNTAGPSRPNYPPKRRERAVGQDARSASNHPPKRRERAVGQDAGPISNQILRRSAASKPSGKTPGLPRTISQNDTRASPLASRWARLKACATARAAVHTAPSTERSVKQAAAAEPCTIRRSSCRRRYRTEPLRLFAVNPLTVGELGRIVMGGVIPV